MGAGRPFLAGMTTITAGRAEQQHARDECLAAGQRLAADSGVTSSWSWPLAARRSRL